ncbi:MAG: DUF2280 domain-containing protein [Pyrinomonadaceae bacterium]
MAILKKEHKEFIVQGLACFDSLSAIAEGLHDLHGIKITSQQVYNYDPTKPANARRVSKEMRELFDKTRAEFQEEKAELGISYLTYRLRRLQRMSERAETMKNYPLAAQLLEQAAKDKGGSFTNRRELTGKDGGAVALSVEDKRRDLAGQMFNKLIGQGLSKEQARETMLQLGIDEHYISAI